MPLKIYMLLTHLASTNDLSYFLRVQEESFSPYLQEGHMFGSTRLRVLKFNRNHPIKSLAFVEASGLVHHYEPSCCISPSKLAPIECAQEDSYRQSGSRRSASRSVDGLGVRASGLTRTEDPGKSEFGAADRRTDDDCLLTSKSSGLENRANGDGAGSSQQSEKGTLRADGHHRPPQDGVGRPEMAAVRAQIARKLVDRLLSAEDAIDMALKETADLAGLMPVARHEAQVSVGIGQEAVEQVIATLSMLAEARKRISKTHAALSIAGRKIGISEQNFGGFIDKPRYNDRRELGSLHDSVQIPDPDSSG